MLFSKTGMESPSEFESTESIFENANHTMRFCADSSNPTDAPRRLYF